MAMVPRQRGKRGHPGWSTGASTPRNWECISSYSTTVATGEAKGSRRSGALTSTPAAALSYLKQRTELDGERIVYFGHSLGSAVCIELAIDHPPYGMALINPFSSIKDMTALILPVPFAGIFVRGHYNSVQRIPKVETPLLIIHSELDEVVPHEQGLKLYRAANRPKRFVTLWGATHNNGQYVAADALADALVDFRNGLPGGDVAPRYTPPMISL